MTGRRKNNFVESGITPLSNILIKDLIGGKIMTNSIEVDTHIIYTDDEGIHLLFAGDRVTCCANGKEYSGQITSIGLCQESNETQPYKAICIDNMQMINANEVTSITKRGLNDTTQYSLNEWFNIINENWNSFPEENRKNLLNVFSHKK